MTNTVWAGGNLGKAGAQPEIVFAQVREDAAVELEVLRSCPQAEKAFCIASGGCTALALLLARPSQLHVVDINPAQVFLVELKQAAMKHLSREQMLRCLMKDARPFYQEVRQHITETAQSFWDAHDDLLGLGLNNCGIIEHRLRQIRQLLPLVQSRRAVRRLFASKSLSEQRRIYQASWDHWRWKLAFEVVLNKPVLRLVYSEDFVSAVPKRFARLMKQRFDEAFLKYPLDDNGYLWQMFRGHYPPSACSLPLYLQPQHYEVIKQELAHMKLECADAAAWLEAQAANSVGFFALSNILEVTSGEYAERLLKAVASAAKPNAKVCLRSIFPYDERMFDNLHLEGAEFEFLPSEHLEVKDRSFFCKNISVMRVLKT